MEDELELMISLALSQGATYAEARYQNDMIETDILKNGDLELATSDERKGISFRAIVDGGLGFGATNQMGKKELRSLVSRVIRGAKESGRRNKTKIAMGQGDLAEGKIILKPRVSFESIDLESRIDLLQEIDSAAVKAAEDSKIKLPGRYLSLDTLLTEKYLITSDGAKVHSHIPRASLDIFLSAYEPSRGSIQRFLSLGESSGWEALERWNVPMTVDEEIRTLANILFKAEAAREERGDVILGPEVVGIISHESSGHPGEADRILGREAAQAGETYLTRESLGMKVGSEVVNVVEDPTLPRSFGYYAIDDEGVRARRRYLIKNGRIEEFLHNRETAHVMGVDSNASARSAAFNREPIVRMSNTFVEPGDLSLEELIEGVDYGVYIKNFMEWNIDDRRYNQRYVGLEAYRIEDGELRQRLRNPVLEVTTIAFWMAVDAVGKDLKFNAATCGKGDPMQGIPVWTGGPHIRAKGLHIGGSI